MKVAKWQGVPGANGFAMLYDVDPLDDRLVGSGSPPSDPEWAAAHPGGGTRPCTLVYVDVLEPAEAGEGTTPETV
jgi:hypothetical protein